MTLIYECISLQHLLSLLGLAAILGIAGLEFGIAMVRDMKMVLKSTNDNAIAGGQSKLQALKKLNEFIELHAMAKELSVIDALHFI